MNKELNLQNFDTYESVMNAEQLFSHITNLVNTHNIHYIVSRLNEYLKNLNEKIFCYYYLDDYLREALDDCVMYNVKKGRNFFGFNLHNVFVRKSHDGKFYIFDNQDMDRTEIKPYYKEYHELLFKCRLFIRKLMDDFPDERDKIYRLYNFVGKYSIRNLFNTKPCDNLDDNQRYIFNKVYEYFKNNAINVKLDTTNYSSLFDIEPPFYFYCNYV
jgi:hypothetical protein